LLVINILSQLNVLGELIEGLQSEEIRLLKRLYFNQNDEYETKGLDLFNLMRQKPEVSDKEASEKIYGKPNPSAFSELKKRLIKNIQDVILLKGGEKSLQLNFHQELIDCRKKIIIADILLSRGAKISASQLLEDISRQSEHFDFPMEQIQSDDLRKNIIGHAEGTTNYEIIAQKTFLNFNKAIKIAQSKDLFKSISLQVYFQANKEIQLKVQSIENLERLKNIYNETKSPNAGFYYYLAGIHCFQLLNDTNTALKFAKSFLELVKNNDAVHSNARVGGANIEIAVILINKEEYKGAMPYIKEALANFREGSENYLQTLQVQWLAYFHNEDLEDATKLLKTIITPELYKKPKITRGKWLYFEAFLEFKKKNYRKSLALISNLKELRQDKSGWLLGCKLLELMNMIEINDPEQLEFYSLGTLKKLISGLEDANTKRIKLIYSILNKILKKDLSFEEAFKFCKKELETLSEGQEEFHWNPTGFELVKFDEWFRSKLNHNPALVSEEF
jgi:hypothetical protein